MKKLLNIVFTIFISIFLFCSFSCSQLLAAKRVVNMDYTPPKFESLKILDSKSILVKFSEECKIEDIVIVEAEDEEPSRVTMLNPLSTKESDYLNIDSVNYNELDIKITTKEKQTTGARYKIKLTAKDDCNNSNSIITDFYGFNEDVPKILINEFRVNGSQSRPDNVELYCLSSGNLAGLALYSGSYGEHKSSYIFPACEVDEGEFIVVHFKPEGLDEEVQEVGEIDVSGGREAFDFSRDFWIKGGKGLSGTNGALTLYTCKGGEVLDCVVYSNRTSSSDTKYRGFGSTRMLNTITEIENLSCWKSVTSSGVETLRPEDCVNPEKSTSTRTICRSSNFSDLDIKTDWHIVPSGACSMGEANTDEVFTYNP